MQVRTPLRAAVTVLAVAVAATACGGGGGGGQQALESGGGTSPSGGAVVVGSANFPENVLLGEIYAQALRAKGVTVDTKLNIGSREVIYSQLKRGGLSVLPEYNGALLSYLDPKAKQTSTAQVNAALRQRLPKTLTLLQSAAAQDKDSITVTRATAKKYDLTAIGDLKPVAGKLVLGGPPEFKTRQQGVIGLKQVYGVVFGQFKALDTAGPITVAALKKGQVDAANLFTTDPAITANDFVPLEDPKNLFGAQNVTPLVYSPALTPTVRSALDAVSAKLDTPTLAKLVAQVVVDKKDAKDVAASWLASVGLA